MNLQLLFICLAAGAWAQDLFQITDDVSSAVNAPAGGACGNVEQDTNYVGSDIKAAHATSSEECCQMCSSEPGCNFFTFHKGRHCYLKGSKTGSKTLKGDVSGAASSSPPAPTPPAPPSPPTPPAPAPPVPPPTPTPSPPAPPTPSTGIPTLDMKNAAEPNMKFPIIGLGTEGHGWTAGQKMECWHWPQCCTKDHCPVINSVAAYIKAAVAKGGVARIDTGYPYGDNAKGGGTEGGCPKDIVDDYMTSARFLRGTQLNATVDRPLHASCDTHGIGLGIKQSGVSRKKIFVSAKVGYAGPMGGTKAQIASILKHMGVGYLDLCMVHFPEVGPGTGSHGEYNGQCPNKECHCVPTKSSYNAETCRYNTYKNMLDDMKAGHCKSVGVFGWTADQIDAVVKKGLEAPSVVQYKFHAHQSTANQIQKDLLAYTKKHGIIFNGIAPLGAPDWVTFTDAGMQTTILEEPVVKAIAKESGKTPAQVLLRWVVQQGVATQARTKSTDRMNENLGIFDFQLSSSDMDKLNGMPQCKTQRGNPYAEGDPNGGPRHDNVVTLTAHC